MSKPEFYVTDVSLLATLADKEAELVALRDQAPVRDHIPEQDLWRRVVLAMLVDARMGIPPVFGASAAEHDAACDFSNWPRNVRRMAGGKAGIVAKWAAYCQTQWFRDIASMVEVDPVELTEEILTAARNATW